MSGSRSDAVAPPAGRVALAERLRERLGPVPELPEWPPVSIVVLNRDGEDHLRLLLPRLATATDYPRFELILVDNDSSDGSVELARSLDLPFPLTIVENDENLSFSDANDDAAERAAFDLLLFLNNDVEPFEPGWLKELVAGLESGDAAAIGATLIHGENYRGQNRADYVLQHRGVVFRHEAGRLAPFNFGDHESLDAWTGEDRRVPALTAACMLVSRADFERVGGFTTGFRWGWEDVDIGLKLGSAGDTLVCSGRSLAIHHESSTRFEQGREWRRETKAHNQRLLLERWGAQLRREYLLDRFSQGGFWSDSRSPRLAMALAGEATADAVARELADSVERLGWRVGLLERRAEGWDRLPDDVDFTVVCDPSFAASRLPGGACVAWVLGEAGDWVDTPLLREAELVLAPGLGAIRALEAAGVAPVLFDGAADAARLVGLLRERTQRLRFCLKLSREWDLEPAALALRRSLEDCGHACSLQLAHEWDLVGGLTADVAVAIGDPADYRPRPAQLNVLWSTLPPPPTECDGWDLVLLPGEVEAAALAAETPATVAALDLDATATAAEPLLELVARAADREGIRSRVRAQP